MYASRNLLRYFKIVYFYKLIKKNYKRLIALNYI